MFSIIIPNYNSEKWIKKLLDSIFAQSFKDYEIIIVDDMSTDKSIQIASKVYGDYLYGKQIKDNPALMKIIKLEEKRWNGGSRNVGVENAIGEYILFADCDDWFNGKDSLKTIASIIKKSHPDIIRLPYKAFNGKVKATVRLKEKSLETFTKSIFCAPWTKCVKRELFAPFPENSLLEDVVQHIAQLDKCETFENCPVPIMVWNRANENAISSDTRKYDKESKRYSSVYRNMADLLDLKCKHDYCEEQRQFRIKAYEDIIERGDILGLINGVKS